MTAVYQDTRSFGGSQAEHGKRLRFAGIVLAPGYLDGAEQKRRAAEASAALAASLGADGVICTTFSSGNSHTDTMLTVAACERRGIAHGGRWSARPTAGSPITCRRPTASSAPATRTSSSRPGPPIASSAASEGARSGERVPAVHYLGGLVQTGDARWTAVPA